MAVAGGALYFVIVALGLLWSWGSPLPDTFANPDESTNRLAASLVAETGSPVLVQPFDDPEDLVHLGTWYSRDGEARPVYPPLTFYLYGFGMHLGGPGDWLALLAGAGGVAALAAAGVLLLPAERRWYGLLLPLVAFPFTFWVIRPWHNAGLAYAFLSVALLCFALWMQGGRFRYFVGCAGLLALAGATRPDLLLYLFIAAYLVALYIDLASWRRITAVLAIGGAGAVGLIALFNWAVVGDPLQSSYQDAVTQPYWGGTSTFRDSLPTPFQELMWALAPFGLHLNLDLLEHLAKHWLLMWPIALVSAWGGVGYWSLLRPSRRRWLLLALGGVFAIFVLSRYCPGCFGAEKQAAVGYSNARYLAGAYLFAAIAALLALVTMQKRWAKSVAVGSAYALVMLAGLKLGGYFWADRDLRAEYRAEAIAVSAALPEGTVVYSLVARPYVWSTPGLTYAGLPGDFPRDPTDATADVSDADFERVASSIKRAHEAGLPAAVLGVPEAQAVRLGELLRPELRLVEAEDLRYSWVVEAERTAAR